MTIRTAGAASLLSEFGHLRTDSRLSEISSELPSDLVQRANRDWLTWARDSQLPPPDGVAPWRTWLMLGGRGAGKTRAGAEWVRAQALGLQPFASAPAKRIALVGETIAAVRSVMIEGVSGLLAVHQDDECPAYEPSKRQVVWRNGAIAQVFSAEEPDALRGPQFAVAWLDEICKWHHADRTFDMLQFALRLGQSPRQVVTTTPRPMALLRRLMGDTGTVTTRMTTRENEGHLAPDFIRQLEARYGGTLLLRQELEGELIEDRADALWRREVIEAHRVERAPALARVVIAVDPPVTSGAKADACGIVVAGLGADGCAYVVDDRTVRGREPLAWAEVAVRAYHAHAADAIVAEVNQGGELVPAVIRQVDAGVPIRLVRATRGKWIRAEPVAALYARGLVRHVGAWPELEDQMCDFGPDGLSGGRSPDRLDALVWALTALMLGQVAPQIREI
jgi:phage terminase large subunit-like protein